MASIRKLESGSYQVRFRDRNGRERSETFAKKAHADRFRHGNEPGSYLIQACVSTPQQPPFHPKTRDDL